LSVIGSIFALSAIMPLRLGWIGAVSTETGLNIDIVPSFGDVEVALGELREAFEAGPVVVGMVTIKPTCESAGKSSPRPILRL